MIQDRTIDVPRRPGMFLGAGVGAGAVAAVGSMGVQLATGVRIARGQLQPRLSVCGDLDRIPLFLKPAPEKLADLRLILDDQNAHDQSLPFDQDVPRTILNIRAIHETTMKAATVGPVL